MKKEVIYFDAGAFGPLAQCELINGYLESNLINMGEEAFSERKKIKLDESKMLYFWKRIDELNKLFETKIEYWNEDDRIV